MTNSKRSPPTDTTAVLYIEQQIDDWIRCQIRGESWQPVEPTQPTFIRKKEVLRRVGLSYFTIWNLERQGRFPKRYRIGEVADAAA
jgi:CP4-57 regulatory protein AlpA